MDPRKLSFDKRLTGNFCVFCGLQADTRDHVPSKVLLDKPYPPQLPVVGACESCNASFSLDEQYLACFIECVICGTTNGTNLNRPNVKSILHNNKKLKERIDATQQRNEMNDLLWQPEFDRVAKIITKLAKGHVAYELYPRSGEPLNVTFTPLPTLSKKQQIAFETMTQELFVAWPEIGTRSFMRASGKSPDHLVQSGDWVVVQPNRYRYAVLETEGILVRILLSEYLACEVYFE